MSGQAEENGLRSHTLGLEQVGGDDLESDNREYTHNDAHPVYGYIDEVRIGSEGPYNVIREKG